MAMKDEGVGCKLWVLDVSCWVWGKGIGGGGVERCGGGVTGMGLGGLSGVGWWWRGS